MFSGSICVVSCVFEFESDAGVLCGLYGRIRGAEGRLPHVYGGSRKRCERMCGVGRGGHQVQLPPRELRSLVESGHCRVYDDLQEQTDGRAHEEELAACVGVWSHSAVDNDKLKDIQRQLEENFHEIYELLRRNDTRCDCIYLFILNCFLERCKCFRSCSA